MSPTHATALQFSQLAYEALRMWERFRIEHAQPSCPLQCVWKLTVYILCILRTLLKKQGMFCEPCCTNIISKFLFFLLEIKKMFLSSKFFLKIYTIFTSCILSTSWLYDFIQPINLITISKIVRPVGLFKMVRYRKPDKFTLLRI